MARSGCVVQPDVQSSVVRMSQNAYLRVSANGWACRAGSCGIVQRCKARWACLQGYERGSHVTLRERKKPSWPFRCFRVACGIGCVLACGLALVVVRPDLFIGSWYPVLHASSTVSECVGRHPVRDPMAQLSSRAVFDEARGRPVLVAGNASTWEWVGHHWVQVADLPGEKQSRHVTVAYDYARQMTIALAGALDRDRRWQAYGWNGSGWKGIGAEIPLGRFDLPEIAYDSVRCRVVAFGGHSSKIGQRGETWELVGEQWLERRPSTDPGCLTNHRLAYDKARKRTVLFGGSHDCMCKTNETWEWDGTVWVKAQPKHQPPARGRHSLDYDPLSQSVVLFGGSTSGCHFGPELSDTWEWNGADWTERRTPVAPTRRASHATYFDRGARRLVLMGGAYSPNDPENVLTTQERLLASWVSREVDGVFDDTWALPAR